MAKTIVSTTINGTEFSFETGRVAKQAGGSVLVRMGESVVLVAATSDSKQGDRDFLPLTCEYRPMAYAAGRIPGGYFKREGRPGPKGILVARMMDRPHRPLFPKNWRAEIQLLAYPISHDIENNTDVLALTGASAATCISDIPFNGPLAGVRVGRVDGEWIANPTKTQLASSDFDMIVASTEHAITMVEGGMAEASEADIIAGLEFGFQACQPLIQLQHELVKLVGKEKREIPPVVDTSDLFKQIAETYTEATLATFDVEGKEPRRLAQRAIREQIREDMKLDSDDEEAVEAHRKLLGSLHEKLVKTTMRNRVIASGVRLDGRATDEIRDISVEVGVLPRTHGSALFTRGETQALVTCTLGTRRDEQRIDELDEQGWNRFMLHYNFPSYSVGETRRIMGPGRREIGHGALAERAVRPTVPAGDDYPYVVRIVSDITESNGSSSMASVCGASLAMMDASVPTSAPVAGIAMGLIKEGDSFAVLSDISGAEDHLGDMDFKVTGTAKGVTAFQMDTKIAGVSAEIMTKALGQAREGRAHILAEMNKVIAEPRTELSAYAPRIVQITISQDRIRDIIGPGGKTIKGMQEATGATINVDDSGVVTVSAVDLSATDAAIKMIRELTQEAEIGKLYLGIVKKVVDFGAFVEIFTGTDGLVHISELAPGRVNKVTDVLDEGDEVLVKCIEVDKSGKIRLSRRAALGDAMGGGSVQAEA